MILQALVQHYENLAKDGKVPKPGWCHAKISYEIDLNENGTILVHRPEEHFMPDEIGKLKRTDQRIYGRSIVDFYRYN